MNSPDVRAIMPRMTAAHDILHWLASKDFPAVICGGYARDTICMRPIRDVDLYVCRSMFHEVAELLFGDERDEYTQFDEADEAYVHQSITFQHEWKLHPDLVQQFGLETDLINLIGVNSGVGINVEAVTSRFNLGICQAGIAVDKPWVSEQFKSDFNDEKISLLRLDWGYEASMKQFLKLQQKYNWPLRVRPEDLEVLF